jgi:8-oxo-dGTP pyrophosphatase MutT (NUDIX family)
MSITIDKVILIASSLIQNKEGKLLLLQRSGTSSYPDYWQFVEGKLEEDEKVDAALTREIQEEIDANIGKLTINTILHNQLSANGQNYLAVRVVFNVELSSEDIKLSDEHKSYGWFTKQDALALQLLPGIEEVIQKLL